MGLLWIALTELKRSSYHVMGIYSTEKIFLIVVTDVK